MKLFDLSDRVALITGGNGGIGFGMAEGLAAAGAAVMIGGRDEAKNEAAIRALRQAGAKAAAVPVDVADEMSCRNMVAATVATLGRLDILVNNAGIGGDPTLACPVSSHKRPTKDREHLPHRSGGLP